MAPKYRLRLSLDDLVSLGEFLLGPRANQLPPLDPGDRTAEELCRELQVSFRVAELHNFTKWLRRYPHLWNSQNMRYIKPEVAAVIVNAIYEPIPGTRDPNFPLDASRARASLSFDKDRRERLMDPLAPSSSSYLHSSSQSRIDHLNREVPEHRIQSSATSASSSSSLPSSYSSSHSYSRVGVGVGGGTHSFNGGGRYVGGPHSASHSQGTGGRGMHPPKAVISGAHSSSHSLVRVGGGVHSSNAVRRSSSAGGGGVHSSNAVRRSSSAEGGGGAHSHNRGIGTQHSGREGNRAEQGNRSSASSSSSYPSASSSSSSSSSSTNATSKPVTGRDYAMALERRKELTESLLNQQTNPKALQKRPASSVSRPAPMSSVAVQTKKRKMNLGPRCTEAGLAKARYPFHQLISILHVAEWSRSARSPYPCMLTLLPSELEKLNSTKIELVARLYDWRKRVDISWGTAGARLTSGRGVEDTPAHKKRRNKNAEYFAPPVVLKKPTSAQMALNLSVYAHVLTSAALVIEQVRVLSCDDIAKNVPLSIDDNLQQSADDGVVETSFKVSLRCPLGFVRIEMPAKGHTCRHVQCFDLNIYLQFASQQLEWFCPICSKSLPFAQLRLSKFFCEVLEFAGDCDDDDLVEIDPNTKAMKLCSSSTDGVMSPEPPPSQPQSQSSVTQHSSQDSLSSSSSSFAPSAAPQAVIVLSDDEGDQGTRTSSSARSVDQRRPAGGDAAAQQPFIEEPFDYFLNWAVDGTGRSPPSDSRSSTSFHGQTAAWLNEPDVIVISD